MTLARIVAASTGAAFEELSAVSASVKDVREDDRRDDEIEGQARSETPAPRHPQEGKGEDQQAGESGAEHDA